MESWLIDIVDKFGYMGIMFLIACENIFPPIPSEVILSFGGFLTTTSDLTKTGVVLSATAGSVLGAIVLYIIGLQLDVSRLEKIVNRWGHLLRLKTSDLHKADSWFDKYGPWTVFFCRFVPLVRSLISIPAGMSNMNVTVFLLLTTAGTLIWNVLLVYVGASIGASWQEIAHSMEAYARVVYLVLIVLVILLAILFFRKRRRSHGK
ncbi:DedA family protein [Sediminibacillus terrae]|uniref:DedA family protein n=1 Tax=Sediminibacillus terrae TaxID=1562106 RepID=UPI001297E4B8|nr:DedA family protein [Sediminibacillus terrae]